MDDEEALRAEFAAFLAYRRAQERTPEKRPAERTNDELWADWVPTILHTVRVRSHEYHRRFALALKFRHEGRELRLGELRPSECSPGLLESWRGALRLARGKRVDRLSGQTRHQVRMALQAMWAYHVKLGELRTNPFAGIPNEEDAAARPRAGYPTPRQVLEFIPHCKPILGAMLTVSFQNGGLRNAELRFLRKSEILWETSEIYLSKERNKNRKARKVLVVAESMEILRAYCAISPSEWVFPSPRDPHKPIPESTMLGWMHKARDSWAQKLAGENIVPHHFRHGYFMDMLGKAADAHVAEQAGVSPAVMANVYGRLRGEEAREAYRRAREEALEEGQRRPALHAPKSLAPGRKSG